MIDSGEILCGGEPTANGLYAVEIYYGWKLLEFKDGEWWHMDFIGRWSADEPLQWVGPLPVRRGQPTSKPDYDL